MFRRVVQYVDYGVAEGYKSVVNRTVDTDHFFTLLQYCHKWTALNTLIYDVGTGNSIYSFYIIHMTLVTVT